MSMVRFVSKFLALGLAPALSALPINNPADICLLDCPFAILPGRATNVDIELPHYIRTRVGYFGNFVYNRRLESASLGLTKQVESARIITNGGFFALDLFDHLTFYGRFGATQITYDSNASAFNQEGDARSGKRIQYFFGTTTSWNLGAQALIFKWRDFFVNLEGQYFETKPYLSYVPYESETSIWYPPFNVPYLYQESQASVGLVYMLNSMVTPFVSLAWSSVHTSGKNYVFNFQGRNLDETTTLINLQNAQSISYTIGSSITISKAINFTLEGQFAGQRAFTAMAQLLF